MPLKQADSKTLTALFVAAAIAIAVPLAPAITARLSAQAQPATSTTTAASSQNPRLIRSFSLGEFGSKAINSDGQVLAFVESSLFKPATKNSPIQILNPETGHLLQLLKGTNPGFPAAISADGQTLVSRLFGADAQGATKTVALKIWDVKTGTVLRTLPVEQNLTGIVALSPDGQMLAVTSGVKNASVQVWDLKSGKLSQTINGKSGEVQSLTFSPSGQILASGARRKTIKLWNLETASLIQTIPVHHSNAIAFSLDSQTVATASYGSTIRITDLRTGKTLRTLFGHTGGISSFAFSPNGQVLASSGYNDINLWDLKTGEQLAALSQPYYLPSFLRFGPQGLTLLATGGFYKGIGSHAFIWQVHPLPPKPQPSGLLRTFAGHFYTVDFVAIKPDGETLVSASPDGMIKLWDMKTGKARHTITGAGSVMSYALSPDGQVLAVGLYNRQIELWNLKTGKRLLSLAGTSKEVNALAFSPDGKILASGSSFGGPPVGSGMTSVDLQRSHCKTSRFGCEEIKLWDVKTGELKKTLQGDSGFVRSLAFSPDGRMLATSSLKIKLWDLKAGKLLRALDEESGVTSVAFSPDSKSLATSDFNGTITLWNLKINNPPRILTGNNGFNWSVTFSPDGKRLAGSDSSSGAINIWNVQSQSPPQTFAGKSYAGRAIAFSPDGRTLAVGGSDKAIKLWQVLP